MFEQFGNVGGNAVTSEHEVGRGCLTSTQTRRRGKVGHFDVGHFIADAIHMGQVLFGMTSELKGERGSMNGARGWKMSHMWHSPF